MSSFVVGAHESMMARVREVLSQQGYECPISNVLSLHLATEQLSEFNPELTLLVLSPDPESAMGVLDPIRPGDWGHVVAVGPADNGRLILHAIRRGVFDYVDETDIETELEDTLIKLKERQEGSQPKGRIIACVGTCGGCGSSTLAVNLATALAKEDERGAVLIDLRLETGDLAALLDLEPVYTLDELCDNIPRIDRSMFEGLLVKHDCGVHLLAPPKNYGAIASVSPEGVREALTIAASLFPFVVADLNHPAHSEQAEALCRADEIVLVLRLDFVALRNAHRILEHLRDLGIERDSVHLVANRCGQPKEVPPAKAAEALNVKELFCIPNEPKHVNLAYNSGVPVLLERPSAKVSKAILSLAMSLSGTPDK